MISILLIPRTVIYTFDSRTVSKDHINRYIVSLQSIQDPELSMWETVENSLSRLQTE